jgi:hypothetical protein
VCVRKVPRVTGHYDASRGGDPLAPKFYVFDLEHFVPSRPPKGAHVTLAVGEAKRASFIWLPRTRTAACWAITSSASGGAGTTCMSYPCTHGAPLEETAATLRAMVETLP